MRRFVLGLLTAAVLLVVPQPAYGDECDELARAGGASDTTTAVERLTAIVTNTTAYSEAQRRAAQSGLTALRTCLDRRGVPADPGSGGAAVSPATGTTPAVAPEQPPVASGASGPTAAQGVTGETRGMGPTGISDAPVCTNTTFVARLAAAQGWFVEARAAARRTLQDSTSRAGSDRVAVDAAKAAYTAELSSLLDAAMRRAQQGAATAHPDSTPPRTLDGLTGTALANVPLGQVEALGNQFSVFCQESSSSVAPSGAAPAPQAPVHAILFRQLNTPTIGFVRKAGSADFVETHIEELAVGDTIRSARGQLGVEILAFPVECGDISPCLHSVGVLYLDEGSEVTFEKLPSGDPVIQVRIGTRVFVKDLTNCDRGPDCLITETKLYRFRPKGTQYAVTASSEGTVTLTVLEGSVLVQDRGSDVETAVAAGQHFTARDDVSLDAATLRQRVSPADLGKMDRWWDRDTSTRPAEDGATARSAVTFAVLAVVVVGVVVTLVRWGRRTR